MSQFRRALDRQGAPANRSFTAPPHLESSSSSSSSSKRKPGSNSEIINVRTSPRQFDAWLKGIGRLPTLPDAKRLRSDVTAQIRRAKSVTGEAPFCTAKARSDLTPCCAFEPDGRQLGETVDGVPVAQWIDYIERLYAAKRKIDKRISKLGGGTLGMPVRQLDRGAASPQLLDTVLELTQNES